LLTYELCRPNKLMHRINPTGVVSLICDMTESMYTGMSLVMGVSKSLIYTNSPNTGTAY